MTNQNDTTVSLAQDTRRGRPSHYTPEQVEAALAMINKGVKTAEVAKATGMTLSNLNYYKRRAGKTATVIPSTDTDNVEAVLLKKYDQEIAMLESTIETATTRLKTLAAKRKRVEKALSVGDAATPPAEERTFGQELAAIGAETLASIPLGTPAT